MKKSITLFLFVLLIFAFIVWLNVETFSMFDVKIDSSMPGLTAAATAVILVIFMVTDFVLTLFAASLGFFLARKSQKIATHGIVRKVSLVLKYVFALFSIGATAIVIYMLAVLFL